MATDEQIVVEFKEPGDHEKMSHYVDKNAQAESWVTGDPVTALCGKVWTPTRDPEKFPVCPSCKEIWEAMGAW